MSRVKAYAKVNLSLKVLGKRADGYHNIDSVFHLIDLYDTIDITASESAEFECNIDPSDLMYKAASLWSTAAGCPVSVVISIAKEIPVAAGLGGGSSDAAAVLCYLDKEFGFHLAQSIAPLVGSDVPFFVSGYKSARVTGRGETVEEMVSYLSARDITLVIPPFKVSTAEAFEKLDALGSADFAAIEPNLSFGRMLRGNFPSAFWHLSGSGGVWFTFDEFDWTKAQLEFIFAKCI